MQDVEKVIKPFETTSTSKVKPSIPEEYQTPQEAKKNERFTGENCDGTANTPNQIIPDAVLRKREPADGDSSGSF